MGGEGRPGGWGRDLGLLSTLTVHGGEHEGDVGGEEVVHLVAQGGLTEETAASHQVTDSHVEVVGA